MKLTARVQRLAEAVSQPAAERAPREMGIVWSTSETRVDPRNARPGDHVAVDLYIEEPSNGDVPAMVRVVERFTRVARDRGVVYDAAGRQVGRILRVRGGVLEWELTQGAAG